jgi:hypothetical protein
MEKQKINSRGQIKTTKELLFQYDTLLHSRVNNWILAETIFLLAAATVWEKDKVLLLLTFLGLITTIVFGFTSFKLYLRVSWLIGKYKVLEPISSPVPWGCCLRGCQARFALCPFDKRVAMGS